MIKQLRQMLTTRLRAWQLNRQLRHCDRIIREASMQVQVRSEVEASET